MSHGKWLVVVTLGLSAGAVEVAAQQAWFSEEASSRGIAFEHDSGHRGEHLFPECLVGGCALVDVDGDGDLDAYLVQSGLIEPGAGEERPANRLFLNDGAGNFTDVTESSGAGDLGYGMGVAAGDYDNDGDMDLYVTNLGRNALLQNNGSGVFEDATEEAGVGDERWGSSAGFLDYDNDGDLDLFVVNYVQWSLRNEIKCFARSGEPDYCSPKNYEAPAPDTLYRNDGDGTFTDVSEQAGLRVGFGNGLGIVCADFDLDGFTDVFIANDGTPDQLWHNLGDGRFEDIGMLAGCAIDMNGQPKAGMGTDVIDLDHDLDPDLLVVNLAGETDSFYRNEGDYFADDTVLVGLGVVSRPFTRFGVSFVDFDHDGWVDLFEANGRVMRQPVDYSDDPYAEPNVLFRGGPSGRFEEVEPRGGTASPVIASARGAAFGDIDGDLDVDILICNKDGPAHLLVNKIAKPDSSAVLRVLDAHGRDAYHAVVEARVGDRLVRREVRSAYSYCSANDPRVYLGLGEEGSAETRVRWIDGAWEDFGPVKAGSSRVLRKGEGRAGDRSFSTEGSGG